MSSDLECFLAAQTKLIESGVLSEHLICKAGEMKTPTLKLLKSAWTNDTHEELRNTSGVFFAIWESSHPADQDRLLYNIHALKMRELKGYKITSRDFASEFRNEFMEHAHKWPNVTTAHGPLTLMQGGIERRPAHLVDDIYNLAIQFNEIVPIIDRLLLRASVQAKSMRA